MVQICCVCGCEKETYANSGISFHVLPKDPKRYQLWVKAIPVAQKLSKWSVVCSQHFKPEDYECKESGRMKLNATAIPSVFSKPKTTQVKRKLTKVQDDLHTEIDIKDEISHSESYEPPQKKPCSDMNPTKEVATQTDEDIDQNEVPALRKKMNRKEKYLKEMIAAIRQLKKDIVNTIKARNN